MSIITSYNASCNLGNCADDIYKSAMKGICTNFELKDDIIKNTTLRIGKINLELPNIEQEDFNTRCNKIILKTLEPLYDKINSFKKEELAIVVATTNSSIEEYSNTNKIIYSELSNPALFLKNFFNLKNFYTTISTACSSGLKAFSIANNLLNKKIARACLVVGIDSLAKLPLFGFNSLKILSDRPSNPFSINSAGINIAEGCGVFIVEGEGKGIEILGIGETSDCFHNTTPNPKGASEIEAIKIALKQAKITPNMVDYINLHGTGTFANDSMEAFIVNQIFKNVPASSTKPLTGHCLGAAPSVEIALCLELLNNFKGKLLPHVYDGQYNPMIEKINLVDIDKTYKKCDIIVKNSFGFGGSCGVMVIRRKNG
ncbi:hypothetical protein IJ670_08835 [bacterium]|nr:hypothetical protein [bacterium]